MGELGFLPGKPPDRHHRMHRRQSGPDHHLREAARGLFPEPAFGYYFLVLTSQRLLENIARLETIVAQHKAAEQAATDTRAN